MARSTILLGSAFASLTLSAAASIFPAAAQTAINLDQLTATQASAYLCAGKITSKALTSAALARAKARTDLNAFITLDEAGALKAAEAFDAGRKKGACKPLGGVPVVIKDNIEVAGLPASAGTPALKGFVPRKDAPVAAKLRAAGAIIIGKTNMHELAFGISGYNTAFKTGSEPGVRNAYDRDENCRRFVIGNGGRDRRADRHRRSRHRHRRLGQGALRAERLRLAAADRRPLPAAGDRADLPHARHRGANGCRDVRRDDPRSRHCRRRPDCARRSQEGAHRHRQIHAGEPRQRH